MGIALATAKLYKYGFKYGFFGMVISMVFYKLYHFEEYFELQLLNIFLLTVTNG